MSANADAKEEKNAWQHERDKKLKEVNSRHTLFIRRGVLLGYALLRLDAAHQRIGPLVEYIQLLPQRQNRLLRRLPPSGRRRTAAKP